MLRIESPAILVNETIPRFDPRDDFLNHRSVKMMNRFKADTTIVRTLQIYTEPSRLDADQLSEASGLHRDLIMELEHAGMVPAVSTDRKGAPVFSRQAIPRCCLIARLHYRESMSFHIIREWLETLDRLKKVELELKQYRRR